MPTDFNGDGATDVASRERDVQHAVGVPASRQRLRAGDRLAVPLNGPNFAASADFNADGRPDLAVASYAGDYVSILLRTPTGFALEGTVIPADGPGAIATGDFNADGRPDLAVTHYDSGGVTVLERQPTSGFLTMDASIPTGVSPRQIDVGDFNADGRPDLAVANFGSNNVTILLRNPASLGFTREGTDLPVGVQPYGVIAADVNQDGRPDVATADLGSDSVTVYHRNASGSGFAGPTTIQVGDGPTGLTAADFDADGVNDIAVASNIASTITVLRGGVTPEAPISVAGGPHQLEVANFDGDALPDLATGLSGASQLGILLEHHPDPAAASASAADSHADADAPSRRSAARPSTPPRSPAPCASRNRAATGYVTLRAGDQIPVGSRVDTRDGRVTLETAGGGKADFFDGLFRITQARGKRPLTTLTLTEQLDCPRARRASAAAKKPKSRKLWGSGSGRFRTTGNYSAATVRGTRWLVTDRCTSTTTRVTQGSVTVRDLVKRRNVIVRASRSYTARKRR